MAVANKNAVAYEDLTDEIITDMNDYLEGIVQSKEYWDKFVHHSKVPAGHRKFASRILIAPKVKKEDIKPRAEFIAPRPTKIAVKTVEKTVNNYGDKAIYSKEDIQFHKDSTINSIKATLLEIAVQKRDWIKGLPFIQSRATITYSTSIVNTAENAAIIFRKNKVDRWQDNLFLAHITPEGLKKLRNELKAVGDKLGDPIRKELDGRTYDVFVYGDFMYSVNATDVMYKNDSTQYIIFQGRRKIDHNSPVDVAKLSGEKEIDLILNPLGSGVLEDEDGNVTSDDNKQQGSVAINMDGLGACVSDDLALLTCEVSVDRIHETMLLENEKSGFVSMSGNEHEITLSPTSNCDLVIDGYSKYDSDAGKYYGVGSTYVKVKVVAKDGYTLGSVTAANWTATYESTKSAELVVLKTTADNDTVMVKVPNNFAGALTIACAATASA